MPLLALLLALVALVLFGLAALNSRSVGDDTRSVALVPLGLAFLTAALICQFIGFAGPLVEA